MTYPQVVVDATAIPGRHLHLERCAAETAAAYSRALGSPSRSSSARPRGDSR